jgi:hypothetical protein
MRHILPFVIHYGIQSVERLQPGVLPGLANDNRHLYGLREILCALRGLEVSFEEMEIHPRKSLFKVWKTGHV